MNGSSWSSSFSMVPLFLLNSQQDDGNDHQARVPHHVCQDRNPKGKGTCTSRNSASMSSKQVSSSTRLYSIRTPKWHGLFKKIKLKRLKKTLELQRLHFPVKLLGCRISDENWKSLPGPTCWHGHHHFHPISDTFHDDGKGHHFGFQVGTVDALCRLCNILQNVGHLKSLLWEVSNWQAVACVRTNCHHDLFLAFGAEQFLKNIPKASAGSVTVTSNLNSAKVKLRWNCWGGRDQKDRTAKSQLGIFWRRDSSTWKDASARFFWKVSSTCGQANISGAASSIGSTCSSRKWDKFSGDIMLDMNMLTSEHTSLLSCEDVIHPPPGADSFWQDNSNWKVFPVLPTCCRAGLIWQVDTLVIAMTGESLPSTSAAWAPSTPSPKKPRYDCSSLSYWLPGTATACNMINMCHCAKVGFWEVLGCSGMFWDARCSGDLYGSCCTSYDRNRVFMAFHGISWHFMAWRLESLEDESRAPRWTSKRQRLRRWGLRSRRTGPGGTTASTVHIAYAAYAWWKAGK